MTIITAKYLYNQRPPTLTLEVFNLPPCLIHTGRFSAQHTPAPDFDIILYRELARHPSAGIYYSNVDVAVNMLYELIAIVSPPLWHSLQSLHLQVANSNLIGPTGQPRRSERVCIPTKSSPIPQYPSPTRPLD